MPSDDPDEPEKQKKAKKATTGDNAGLPFYMGMLITSLLAMAAVVYNRRRYKGKH